MSDTEALIVVPEPLKPAVGRRCAELKAEVLAGTALVSIVRNKAENDIAAAAVAKVTELRLAAQKAHKEEKTPYLRACQQFDAVLHQIVDDLVAEEARVNTLCGNWKQAELEKVREAERARQAELDRIERERREEAERIAAEARRVEEARLAEERRKEAERQAEAQRLAQEAAGAKSKAARAEFARKQAELEARQKAERLAERAAAEVERKRVEAETAKRLAEQEALAKQAAEAVGPAVEMSKTAGQTVKAQWTFEVTDIYKLVRARADLCEIKPRTAMINEAIALGVREIPGLKISEMVKTRSRTSEPRAIDV